MKRTVANWVVCATLSVLTLGVFAAAQSAGPESTVRRYLRALAANDVSTQQMLLTTPVEAMTSQALAYQSQILSQGEFRVKAKERSGDVTLVVTDHEVPIRYNGTEQIMAVTRFWILVRRGGQWRIDPDRTFRYAEQSSMNRR